MGKPWGSKEFADECGVDIRTVRYWLRGEVPPTRNKETIERVLFGDDPTHAEADRKELRVALSEQKKPSEPKIKLIFDGVPPLLTHLFDANKNLKYLASLLSPGSEVHSNAIALFGMSGVGKSTLATAYAHSARTQYKGIWWSDARSRSSLLDRLGILARLLGYDPEPTEKPEEIAAAALQLLAGGGKPWLLIYDNVASPSDVADLIPHAAHLVITSLYPEWSGLAYPFPITPWSDEAAIEFLQRQTGQEDRESAARLNEYLDGLPLALDQAAAHCRRGMPLARYAERVDELIRSLPPSQLFPRSVAATFELAIERALVQHLYAGIIISILGYCAPGIIPEELYRWLAENQSDIDDGIIALADSSLVQTLALDSKRSAIWIHPLVTSTARQWSSRSGSEKSTASIVRFMLRDTFPTCETLTEDDISLGRLLLPHLDCMIRDRNLGTMADDAVMEDADVVVSLTRRLGKFMHEARWQLMDLGVSRVDPTEVLELAHDLATAELGPDHPETLACLEQLAKLHLSSLEYKKAIPFQEAIVEQLQKDGNTDLSGAFNARVALAHSYGKSGDIDRASDTAEDAYELWSQRSNQPFPPSSILRDIGEVYIICGQSDEGRYFLSEAIKVSRDAGDIAALMSALLLLGYDELDDNYIERARGRFKEAMDLYDKHADEDGVLLLPGTDCLLDPDRIFKPERYDKVFAEDLWRMINFLAYEQ